MSTLPVLQAAPEVTPRTETVDVSEWGGAVIVRGLTASELFAVQVIREQAIGRARQAAAEHAKRVKALPDDAEKPEFEPPLMNFGELVSYGRYISEMLARAVTSASGLGLYTVEQWELAGQQHPGVLDRLQSVVERLSGLNTEDVRKN